MKFIMDARVVTFISANNKARKDAFELAASTAPNRPGSDPFRKYLTIDLADFASPEGVEYRITQQGKNLAAVSGRDLNKELRLSFGIGIIVLHELLHSFDNLDDPKGVKGIGLTGPVVDEINKVRSELNIPERNFYLLRPLSLDPLSPDYGKGEIDFSLNGVVIGAVTLSKYHNGLFRFKELLEDLINESTTTQWTRNRARERLIEVQADLKQEE